jgi:hypothetical protein
MAGQIESNAVPDAGKAHIHLILKAKIQMRRMAAHATFGQCSKSRQRLKWLLKK